MTPEQIELIRASWAKVMPISEPAAEMFYEKLFELDPDILITGNGPGGNAATVLDKANIKIYIGVDGMTVRKAYDTYKKDELKEFK